MWRQSQVCIKAGMVLNISGKVYNTRYCYRRRRDTTFTWRKQPFARQWYGLNFRRKWRRDILIVIIDNCRFTRSLQCSPHTNSTWTISDKTSNRWHSLATRDIIDCEYQHPFLLCHRKSNNLERKNNNITLEPFGRVSKQLWHAHLQTNGIMCC